MAIPEPHWWWMELDESNLNDLRDTMRSADPLIGIVSDTDGGIVAYTQTIEMAQTIVDTLNGRWSE